MPKVVTTHPPMSSNGAVTQLVQTAEAVVARIIELLDAPVTIIDQHAVVVASTDPQLVGLSFDIPGSERQPVYLRVPLQFDGHAGEVIVGEPLNGEVISPRLAQVLVELVISQTTVEWLGQGKQPDFKNRFIHDLLHGLLTDEAAIMREARLLGLDFGPPRAVILIDAADYILGHVDGSTRTATEVEIQRRAQVVIGSIVDFLYLPNDTICAYIGAGEVVVLKASNTQSLANWAERADTSETLSPSWTNLNALKRAGAALLKRLQSDTGATLSIGLGRYHPGLQGLARSYQDARAALSLGRRFHGQNHVHCLDGLGVAAFVGVPDERTKIELSTYLLSPLNHNPELLQTLAVFFAHDCCPSATSSQLSIHRNTLSHRLDKIAALTGLDPRCFDDAVQIRIALLLRDLQTAA
jgi:carbohydrate diacid regulator